MNDISTIRDREQFSIAEVQKLTGLPGRTVRFYISQGLIPPAHGRGPSAKYDRGQVLRLQLIQQLKADHLALDEIKRRLNGLTDREIASRIEPESRPSGETWRRIELYPGVELHVQDQPAPKDRKIDEIVNHVLDTILPSLEAINRSENGRRS